MVMKFRFVVLFLFGMLFRFLISVGFRTDETKNLPFTNCAL